MTGLYYNIMRLRKAAKNPQAINENDVAISRYSSLSVTRASSPSSLSSSMESYFVPEWHSLQLTISHNLTRLDGKRARR